MANFDWRNPDFSIGATGEPIRRSAPYLSKVQVAVQNTKKYAKKAPKKTLRKKPRTNAGSYQWDKGMTFEEKARMLANSGTVLGSRSRRSAFIDDFDRYQSPTEQVMDYLRNASPHVQRYYGVYDDIEKERNVYPRTYDPVNNVVEQPIQREPVRPARRSGRASVSAVRPQSVAPMPTIEPEVLVDRTPLDTDDTTKRDWGLWNPTTAMTSYQADAGLRRAAMAPIANVPLTGVQLGYGGFIMPDIILY